MLNTQRLKETGLFRVSLGCPTSNFLNFLGILYPPNFGCLGGTRTFSTATRFNDSYAESNVSCERLPPHGHTALNIQLADSPGSVCIMSNVDRCKVQTALNF